jgi:hypothetical protein
VNTPNGLSAIISTFGDIHAYVDEAGNLRPEWQTDYLAMAELPFPLALAWNPNVKVSKMLCHKLLVEIFEQVFGEIVNVGLQTEIVTFGGCFNFRQQRTGLKLSTHCWGIAIDLNPATNEQGTEGTMNPDVVTIFRSAGFKWGGDFVGKARDPMHFQYANGY